MMRVLASVALWLAAASPADLSRIGAPGVAAIRGPALSGSIRFLADDLLASPALAGEPDFTRHFSGRDTCFELNDLKANKLVARSNPSRCAQRTSPCSTFKVPLALLAFDAGILKDETSAMKWDGTKTNRDAWNRDQAAATWIQNSVIWFSQRLTVQLGMEQVKAYLSRFDFGDAEFS